MAGAEGNELADIRLNAASRNFSHHCVQALDFGWRIKVVIGQCAGRRERQNASRGENRLFEFHQSPLFVFMVGYLVILL
ncbi:hypothetical protein [Kordiimonas gwangyangensis]|uniref:hypothetical protein n=1 Tax=Kordiimonas gwangyangensis TaxID=288022 RepID=UPI000A465CCE|nr:hypothetical protein [Kordiimonas gwangyangensis]